MGIQHQKNAKKIGLELFFYNGTGLRKEMGGGEETPR